MKAGSINLQRVFEQTIRYRIPLFQRPYVWTEEDNWQPIWDDVRILAERYLRRGSAPPHFLGAIVLDQLRGQTGGIEVRQVIDGQQRLTTIQILLAVLRDIARLHGLEKHATRFEKLTANDSAFQDDADDEFKVWPTNRDRADYRRTLKAGSDKALRKIYEASTNARQVGARIPDAYLYFHRAISGWISHSGLENEYEEPLCGTAEERFEALWTIVRGHLMLVAIDLDEDDDAQVIFETLNARGTQLLPADLVKNFLFRLAELEEAPVDAYYERYWQQFDEDFWREEVAQGRMKRPRIDLFLQHYLTLKTNDEVNVGHIFGVYKEYAESLTKPGDDGDTTCLKAEDHLVPLKQYGRVFRRFYEPAVGSRAGVFFERLNIIDTATVYPFLLEAFHSLDGTDESRRLDEILTILESFLVRRMICGLTPKNYNRLFLDLVRDVERAGEVTSERVQAFLMKAEGDSVRWPDDEELLRAFLTRPFYTCVAQAKQRMVLLAIDGAMETGKTETIVVSRNLTIEHLMPQSWHSHWPIPTSKTDESATLQAKKDNRDVVLHTIGNLTLLTDKLNPSVANSSWPVKRPEILKHSKLNMNRYFQDFSTWTEEDITTRGRILCEFARQVWPHPKNV